MYHFEIREGCKGEETLRRAIRAFMARTTCEIADEPVIFRHFVAPYSLAAMSLINDFQGNPHEISTILPLWVL